MSNVNSEILVVGAGPSGVCLAIQLKRNGFDDFIVLEKAGDVGGTWRDHVYPGLTVDVPTVYYSYSFELNPDWSNFYAPRKELYAYFRHCAEKYGVLPHMRFNKTVADSEYDAARNCWVTHLGGGEVMTSRYLISATGFLNIPKLPEIKGIETFAGKLLHTSDWDNSHDMSGERVGFIGTGATGIQLIPEVAQKVAHLDVYQRTPMWLLPKLDFSPSPGLKSALKNIPGFYRALRLFTAGLMEYFFFRIFTDFNQLKWLVDIVEKQCIKHLHRQVPDPMLRERLTPNYSYCCKRPSFSNTFYPTFNRSNVELITTPIREVTSNSVITEDGTERKIDTLICATGYQVFEKDSCPTFPVYGKDRLKLSDYWDKERYQAFRGVAVSNFPNYLMIFGPYSVCHTSYIGMTETSVHHVIRVLKAARRRQANYIEIKSEAQAADFKWVLSRRDKSVWSQGRNCLGSHSYYYDRHGDNPLFRPSNAVTAWFDSHFFNIDNYTFNRLPVAV